MSNIPYEAQQRLPITVEQIKLQIAKGMAVSGDELRRAIEWSVGHPLDHRLREVISMFSVAAVKRRGRPSSSKARDDFALKEVDERYPELLQEYEEDARQRRLSAAADGTALPSAQRTPSELAYTDNSAGDEGRISQTSVGRRFVTSIPHGRTVIFVQQNTTSIPMISKPKSSACFLARRDHNYSGDFA